MLAEVLLEALELALMAVLTWISIAVRPNDPVDHLFVGLFRLLLAGAVVASLPANPGIDLDGALALTTVALTGALAWRRRRQQQKAPPPKRQFSPLAYGVAAVLLVYLHERFAWLSAQMHASDAMSNIELTPSRQDDLIAWLVLTALFFLVSQVSTGALQRGFASSLQHNWAVVENFPHRRLVLLALLAAPIAACIVPSVQQGAMLGGVLTRLGTLGAAWWLARDAPREHDAEFLSWGTRKTAVAALRQLAHGDTKTPPAAAA